MFSEESNKLETYTYVRTKYINKLKNTDLFVDLPILEYIYIYVCVCVCVCVCITTMYCCHDLTCEYNVV